jgi:beta-lactamase class A
MILRSHFAATVLTIFLVGCTAKTSIPTEFPTPEPPPAATPIPAIVLNRDAELEKQFATIAEAAKGKVGAAAVVLETGDAALLNADGHYPMQSVYKLPICMAMMDSIRRGRHDLDEKIGVTPADYVRQGQGSPLRDKYPEGGEFTIRELMRYTLVESDGSASDVLLRLLGDATVVQDYVEQIGVRNMQIVNTEKEMGRNWDTQYQNWATPDAAVEVLRWFYETTESSDQRRLRWFCYPMLPQIFRHLYGSIGSLGIFGSSED